MTEFDYTRIFKFSLSKKVNMFKKNVLNLDVELRTNNFHSYYKVFNRNRDLISEKVTELIETLRLFQKARHPRDMSFYKEEFLFKFDSIKILYLKTSPESKLEFEEKSISVDLIRDDKYKSEDISNILDLFDWIEYHSSRKREMIERLKQLENKKLRALVYFEDEHYETHFTKYHLNLEHFSELMHSLLKDELDKEFMTEYLVYENLHKRYIKINRENLKIRDFNIFVEKIFDNYEKFEENFNEMFLKAQYEYPKIKKQMDEVLELNQLVIRKFRQVYLKLREKNKKKSKELFFKSLSLFYDFKVSDFVDYTINDALVEKIVSFIIDKNIQGEDYLADGNLQIVDSVIYSEMKKRVARRIHKKEEFEQFSATDQYFIRKADRNIFEKNHNYSHLLVLYNFLNDNERPLNKYINAGFDKIYKDSKITRIKGKVYSSYLKRTIKYSYFIKMDYYYFNIGLRNTNIVKIAS